MAKQYRVTPMIRLINGMVGGLARRGRGPQRTWLLTTTGRRSGKKQTTPVSPIEIGNDLYLVSPYGEVGWVLNARASGEAWLQRGPDRKHVRLVEVSPEEAAPIIKAYLQREPFARKYATLDPDAPVEDFRAEAHQHPVFRIEDA